MTMDRPSFDFDEIGISRAIVTAYHQKLSESLVSDVLIIGAGPAGLTAAWHLARQGKQVIIVEKRLSPGGGIWGGAAGMNDVVVQEEALGILQEAGVRCDRRRDGLCIVDAAEMASALCLKAIQSGAILLNLFTVEDLCVRDGKVTGVVANRTTMAGQLPVDPIVFTARAVVDGTGHEAIAVQHLKRRRLLPSGPECPGEGLMDAPAGERFVVDHVTQVHPGLWVCGMAVCATFGGPRMGPIFGGMLLSGQRLASQLISALAEPAQTGAGVPRQSNRTERKA